MKTDPSIARTMPRFLVVCSVGFSVVACQSRRAAEVHAVAEMHGVLLPHPTTWRAFKTKQNGVIFRESGREKDAWIQFDPPMKTESASSLASRTLKGNAAIEHYKNLYRQDVWLQKLKVPDGERIRGVVASSKGPIAFRGLLRADASKAASSTELNSIIGWVDAPADSVPEGVTREVLVDKQESH